MIICFAGFCCSLYIQSHFLLPLVFLFQIFHKYGDQALERLINKHKSRAIALHRINEARNEISGIQVSRFLEKYGFDTSTGPDHSVFTITNPTSRALEAVLFGMHVVNKFQPIVVQHFFLVRTNFPRFGFLSLDHPLYHARRQRPKLGDYMFRQ